MKTFNMLSFSMLIGMMALSTVEGEVFFRFNTPDKLKNKKANKDGKIDLSYEEEYALEFFFEVAAVEAQKPTTRQLRGINQDEDRVDEQQQQRRVQSWCPPNSMSCPKCDQYLTYMECRWCGNCDRRLDSAQREAENIFPIKGKKNVTVEKVSGKSRKSFMAGKLCKQVSSDQVQSDFAALAAEKGITEFPSGFDLSEANLQIFNC